MLYCCIYHFISSVFLLKIAGLVEPYGIAIDWSDRILFYTDIATRVIGMASLDGSKHAIIHQLTLMSEPRDIVVAPEAM